MNPMASVQREITDNSKNGIVITKAVIRSSEWLGISSASLSEIIGISPASVSRMKSGKFFIEGGKSYELSSYFIRAYRSLFSIISGDQKSARGWINNYNTALNGVPLELMKTIRGLNDVCSYLDSRRAIV